MFKEKGDHSDLKQSSIDFMGLQEQVKGDAHSEQRAADFFRKSMRRANGITYRTFLTKDTRGYDEMKVLSMDMPSCCSLRSLKDVLSLVGLNTSMDNQESRQEFEEISKPLCGELNWIVEFPVENGYGVCCVVTPEVGVAWLPQHVMQDEVGQTVLSCGKYLIAIDDFVCFEVGSCFFEYAGVEREEAIWKRRPTVPSISADFRNAPEQVLLQSMYSFYVFLPGSYIQDSDLLRPGSSGLLVAFPDSCNYGMLIGKCDSGDFVFINIGVANMVAMNAYASMRDSFCRVRELQPLRWSLNYENVELYGKSDAVESAITNYIDQNWQIYNVPDIVAKISYGLQWCWKSTPKTKLEKLGSPSDLFRSDLWRLCQIFVQSLPLPSKPERATEIFVFNWGNENEEDWKSLALMVRHFRPRDVKSLLSLLFRGPAEVHDKSGCWKPCDAKLTYQLYGLSFRNDATKELFQPVNDRQFSFSDIPLKNPKNYKPPGEHDRVVAHHPILCEVCEASWMDGEYHLCCRPIHMSLASNDTNAVHKYLRIVAERCMGITTSDSSSRRKQKMSPIDW